MSRFTAVFTRTDTIARYIEIEVEAKDSKEAERIADEISFDGLDDMFRGVSSRVYKYKTGMIEEDIGLTELQQVQEGGLEDETNNN